MKSEKIILFDGICNLCNQSVQFVLEHDKNKHFRFASLQSEFGQMFLRKHGLDTKNFDSIVLLDGDTFFTKSDAVLRIAKELHHPARLLSYCAILPKNSRDFFYSFIAKNRYRLFGKKESCWLPTPELKSRFLD
ncbi:MULTISPECIES: thiol-disulfide oxidoreductase DCC family protein [Weeksella]|uniref:Thiol-disulfide oxidoreductase DCC n=1 Tax=Weeksella virosa (strain ATCC 43766 / DSM 16922 / JCM 21250 / CCUG 30538 / CDC 9751 / IAM 14551 / NBRC 16016 / NCTC 11634 / CL345/78) TaxID=865938 RepID=F0NZI1_WEEVC|nr:MULTISPECIES: thiol-disulfide oxidoreductase DCC family protein [Weeksella]ADX68328.1 thiol-disulfide oxidoreductase DCC [Weeksella virosa DSM 16922]MDK7674714.1 thiol-disulfide oxidoreductase DCC family protein [Weeksella virosa]OFM83115.1 thiol-disulfide oxidoreductase [Weeksella sp. HMSC059D05]SUP54647.1 Protein of uncharacterised function, DUF393 [Weeksella virosa]VEH64031.1 Protein of uncharacterised function, DUF393 [Weeksella virosa]